MVIKAVIDRFENGNAILLAEEVGMEVTIPISDICCEYKKGDVLSLTLNKSGNVSNYYDEVKNDSRKINDY